MRQPAGTVFSEQKVEKATRNGSSVSTRGECNLPVALEYGQIRGHDRVIMNRSQLIRLLPSMYVPCIIMIYINV